jgi:hypothetical protein
MAVESPPFALSASSYGAEQTRRALYLMLARGATVGSVAGGVVAASDLLVTAGSGMQVLVAPGECVVPGSTSATQSGYYGRVSSSSALSIAASDPSLPRVDRVVAVVKDAAYSGAENTFSLAVLTGTPTSGATLGNRATHGYPAAPASSLTLAAVLVPNGATSIISGDIEDTATQTLLAVSLAAQAVTVAAEAVADSQIVAGRALLETGNPYGAQIERVHNTEYEPSATRPTFVTLEWSATSNIAQVRVAGTQIGSFYNASLTTYTFGFLVPPSKKWRILGEGLSEIRSSYLTL